MKSAKGVPRQRMGNLPMEAVGKAAIWAKAAKVVVGQVIGPARSVATTISHTGILAIVALLRARNREVAAEATAEQHMEWTHTKCSKCRCSRCSKWRKWRKCSKR